MSKGPSDKKCLKTESNDPCEMETKQTAVCRVEQTSDSKIVEWLIRF